MSEERLQEIKDSVEFQYTIAKTKGYDNALLFTNEEEELIEEIEKLKEQLNDEIDDGLKQSEIMVKQHNEIERLNTDKEQLNSLVNSCQEEIRRLNKKIEIKNKRIQQLMNRTRSARINKAIEYIETKYDYLLGDDTFLDHDERIDRKQITNLLEILKGSE